MDERNDYNSIPMQPTQTAVEWLIEQCPRIETIVAYHVLEQAKQMEKEQMKEISMKSEGNMITDWLDQNRNPEIDSFIEKNLAITEKVRLAMVEIPMAQQTAVELFIEQLEQKSFQETEGINQIHITIDANEYLTLKEQAKAMEKQQIEMERKEISDQEIEEGSRDYIKGTDLDRMFREHFLKQVLNR